MADLICIAVSLALAAFYVIRLVRLPAVQQARRRGRGRSGMWRRGLA